MYTYMLLNRKIGSYYLNSFVPEFVLNLKLHHECFSSYFPPAYLIFNSDFIEEIHNHITSNFLMSTRLALTYFKMGMFKT